MQQVLISKKDIEILLVHSKNSFPNESCALLFGYIELDHFKVKEVLLTQNIERSPINFTISNEELIRAYHEEEKKGLDLVGIFHSHPYSLPYPSSTDEKFMAINPVPWIIFSNPSEKFRAFLFVEKTLELQLSVV